MKLFVFYIEQFFNKIVDAVLDRCMIVDPELWDVVDLTPIVKRNGRIHELDALTTNNFWVLVCLGAHRIERSNLNEDTLVIQERAVFDAELTLSKLFHVHMRVVTNEDGVLKRPIVGVWMKKSVYS